MMHERIAILERQVKDNSSTILRFRQRFDQIGQSLSRDMVRITDLEAQRGVRTQGSNKAIHSYNSKTVEPKLRHYFSSVQRFCERLHQTETSFRRNTMRIADLEAQSGARALGSN